MQEKLVSFFFFLNNARRTHKKTKNKYRSIPQFKRCLFCLFNFFLIRSKGLKYFSLRFMFCVLINY
jgi:hypothetical protein